MSKRFDDYQEVNCNKCEEYWNSTCDGVKIGEERKCTAYRATRDIDYEQRLIDLENQVQVMQYVLAITACVCVVLCFL